MCEYSLYTIQNRLAGEGEELVLHRFETGTLGFASLSDLSSLDSLPAKEAGFWSTMKHWLLPRQSEGIPAICNPPSTRLLLNNVPPKVQRSLRIGSPELVIFTEISDRSYSYRDAVVLPNGARVLLQDLPEGLHALVLFMSPEPATKPADVRLYAA